MSQQEHVAIHVPVINESISINPFSDSAIIIIRISVQSCISAFVVVEEISRRDGISLPISPMDSINSWHTSPESGSNPGIDRPNARYNSALWLRAAASSSKRTPACVGCVARIVVAAVDGRSGVRAEKEEEEEEEKKTSSFSSSTKRAE
ncbi:hypothetical protein PUN28_003473 [Cardiocondyla obscurior]|uniref:Uncharacterized protein n=1 Tax=Cardiocondyla obscurior TaxID=286306 RepID=A0AAW2GMC3_9HYME